MVSPLNLMTCEKLSIVTVCYNSARTIRDTLKSVAGQTYPNIEHIIIDGGSTDETLSIVNEFQDHISKVISEPDQGIYDAMNKGITQASGDVIGILNSDDIFYNEHIAELIMREFQTRDIEALFGDIVYFPGDKQDKVIRTFRSHLFKPERMAYGLIIPHPALFFRRRVYETHGLYNIDYKIAGDFDYIARVFSKPGITYYYLPKVLVKMRTGGASTQGLRGLLINQKEILQACRRNGIQTNYLKISLRYFLKCFEFCDR